MYYSNADVELGTVSSIRIHRDTQNHGNETGNWQHAYVKAIFVCVCVWVTAGEEELCLLNQPHFLADKALCYAY